MDELEQLNIATCENRRPQRGDQRYLVPRRIDGPQAIDEVPDILGPKDHRLALQTVRDVGRGQGSFQYVQPGSGGQQYAYILIPGLFKTSFIPVSYGPSFSFDLSYYARDGLGFDISGPSYRTR